MSDIYVNLKKDDKKYVSNTYARNDVLFINSNGNYIYDENGKEYLDFTSGIGVNSLGFCNKEWVNAVCQQAGKLQHISNLYYTAPCIELAKKLCEKTKAKCVFFSNSGAESNEGAIKIARKYSKEKYGENRNKIITLKNSFHGRTLATLKATGQDTFHVNYGPFPEGFLYTNANSIEDFKNLTLNETGFCAVMIEMVQGEGGVISLNKEYVTYVANWCKENDVLLIVDEVQTGVGRTGTFLCVEQYNIAPDIVTLAKGLGGGLPIGAILFYEKVENTFTFGDHGSTYGGNPITCAGANVVIDTIDSDFLKKVIVNGEKLKKEIEKLHQVDSVDGLGLMLGISFKNNIESKDVLKMCMEKGLLCLTAKEKLRLLPPLTINEKEIKIAVDIIKETLEQLT